MSDPLLARLSAAPPQGWDTEHILPDGFLPMLASSANAPLDSSEHAYEVKWEGFRVLAGLEGPKLFVRTGTGQDGSFWFPELQELRDACEPRWVLVDGEMIRLQGDQISAAGLQERIRTRSAGAIRGLVESAPLVYMVYDILRIGDSWLTDVSWDERRDILTRALKPTPHIRIAPTFREGAAALELARAKGLESVVAKKLRGRYTPGEKTRDWLSIRPLETVETVICGWMEGRGARLGSIGSLVLGVRRGDQLEYAGHTGTGIDAQTLHELMGALEERRTDRSPFPVETPIAGDIHWVEPELECRVRVQGWTETGHMKGPTFLGMTRPLAGVEA